MMPEVSVVALQILFAVLVVWYYFQTKDRLEKLDRKIKGIDAKLALLPQQSTLRSEMDEVRVRLEELKSLVGSVNHLKAGSKPTRSLSSPETFGRAITSADPLEAARRTGRSRAEVELLMKLQELQAGEVAGGRL
jgi:hypothetical protein